MFKKIMSLVLTLVLVLSLSACQSKKSAGIDSIKQKGKLVLGTEATFPPYEGIDEKGNIVGFDIDLGHAIAKKLGVELEIKDIKFDGLIPALMGDTIDIIAAGMTVDEERKKSVDFSDIYYTGLQILVIKEDNNAIKTAADMKGKKIGAQLGTTSEKAANLIPGIEFKSMDKVDQLMLSVKNGMLDGVVVDDTVGVEYVKSISGLKIVKIAELNEGEAGMGIAVKKGNTELVQLINDTLKELKSSGEFDKLVDKWGLLK